MTDKPKKSPNVVLPRGTAAFVHVNKPDDTAPKNATFKPDGKYKITLVYDSESALGDLQEAVVAYAKAKWPDVDSDDVKMPWTTYDADDEKEYRAGKTTIIAKSKFKPALVDSKRKELPASVKIFGGDVCKAVVGMFGYEKAEQVREGKKTVTVKVHGVSLQLNAVQLIEKRGGSGGGADMFSDEDGFEAADEADEAPVTGGAGDDAADF